MNSILYIGSSIFHQWENVNEVLPNHSIKNAAIPGSETAHWLEWAPSVFRRKKPTLLCYYCGSNDINNGVASESIVENTLQLLAMAQSWNSGMGFVYHSIIKAPEKADCWADVDQINQTIKHELSKHPETHFIDINGVFFTETGDVRMDFFLEDGLHLTPQAYQALTLFVRPTMEKLIEV